MENRRKNVRVEANLIVLLKASNTRMARGSRIKNVSETGICVPLNHYFPVDSLIELEIRSVYFEESIKASARVVRVANRDNNISSYEVGAVFLDIPDPANRYVLYEYIRRSIASLGESNLN